MISKISQASAVIVGLQTHYKQSCNRISTLKMPIQIGPIQEASPDSSEDIILVGTKQFKQGFQASSYLGSFPYCWDSRERRVKWKNNSKTKSIFLLQFVAYNLYIFFLFCSWLRQTITTKTEQNDDGAIGAGNSSSDNTDVGLKNTNKNTTHYVLAAHSVAFLIQWSTFNLYGTQHTFFNHFLKIGSDYQKQYGLLKSVQKPIFIRTTNFVKYSACVVVILNLVSIYLKPDRPHFMTSLIPGSADLSRWALSPLILLQCYIWITQWVTMYTLFIQLTMYPYWMVIMLKMLKPKQKSVLKTEINIADFLKGYRSLQVLQNEANTMYLDIILHMEIIGIVTSILGIYTTVRGEGLQGARSLISGLVAIVLLLSYFIQLAEINDASTELLRSWKKVTSRGGRRVEILSKFVKSAMPIRMKIGNFIFADRALVLTIISIIINNSASLFLAK